jgi:hypothetical protein
MEPPPLELLEMAFFKRVPPMRCPHTRAKFRRTVFCRGLVVSRGKARVGAPRLQKKCRRFSIEEPLSSGNQGEATVRRPHHVDPLEFVGQFGGWNDSCLQYIERLLVFRLARQKIGFDQD